MPPLPPGLGPQSGAKVATMEFLRGLVGAAPPAGGAGTGGAASGAAGTSAENTGLLSDWASYSRTSDIEAGTASTVQQVRQWP